MAVQPLYQQQSYSAQKSRLERIMQRVGAFTLEYWALMITILLGIIVFAALSVPVLTYLGLNDISKPIFYTLHLICAQIPSHSFYIMGHQLGMCARNMSIYGSMFAGGVIFLLSKKRLPGIPWWAWLLLILPMAYDGITQMFGWRESTWELRVITGTLFGLANMWFALPFIQKTLKQTMIDYTVYNAPPAALAPVPALPITPQPVTSIVTTPQPLVHTEETADSVPQTSALPMVGEIASEGREEEL
jgi:uncharacterized membrane protein